MPVTQQSGKRPDNSHAMTRKAGAYGFFPAGNGFDMSARAISRALLQTQQDAEAYLQANRDFLDEMQQVVRKEQDIAMEIFDQLLKRMAEEKWPKNMEAALAPAEVNALFERAVSGVREMGEAWVKAQLRMINTMRSHVRDAALPKGGKASIEEAA